jgi:hypothetical protein
MAPKKCPETQKSPDVAVLLRSKSRRGPQELEPEAKKLRVQGPGTACAAALAFRGFRVLAPEAEAGVVGACAWASEAVLGFCRLRL